LALSLFSIKHTIALSHSPAAPIASAITVTQLNALIKATERKPGSAALTLLNKKSDWQAQ
jgi:hypothetical protein